MTYSPPDTLNSFVPNDLIIPSDFGEANLILTDYFRNVVDALNDKEIAQYSTEELITGQKFFTAGDPQDFQSVYRKVIDFGALPNSAAKTEAHGISWTANTRFTRIYGVATNPSTQSIPIPYVDPAALNNGIAVWVDTTNVNIKTAINYSSYTSCYVVLEYIQN